MKIIRLVLFSFIFFLQSFCCHAQNNPSILSARAFSKMIIPGNAPENNVQPGKEQITYIIYLVIKGKQKPVICDVWINKRKYGFTITSTGLQNIEAGTDANSNKKITIETERKNLICILETSAISKTKKIPAKFENLKAGTVLISSERENKIYFNKTLSIISLSVKDIL